MNQESTVNVNSRWCRILLYSLVTTIVFEGIIRKFIPALGTPLFFLKDIICILGVYYVFNLKYNSIVKLKNLWLILLIIFIPLLIYTSVFDPVLALFGLKQYLLYFVTALLVPASFPSFKLQSFSKFYFYLSFLLIPTAIIAILQNSLPASHWLNRSVEGDSLEGFAAGGYLRVSSTFSFTAQYSYYVVASTYFLAMFLVKHPINNFIINSKIDNLLKFALPILLLVSAYITGGRTAVIGCFAIFILGYSLLIFKGSFKAIRNGIIMSIILFAAYSFGTIFFPQAFAAYQDRSKGRGDISHNEEIADRVLGSFTSWTDWFVRQGTPAIIFGNGIGVMSNGSDKLSNYSKKIRNNGFWMETDLATTAWEGGIYLLIAWNLLRIYIIFNSFLLWRKLKSSFWITSSSFLVAYIAIIGATGTLGIQPPLAIWWWLAYGTLLTISNFEEDQLLKETK